LVQNSGVVPKNQAKRSAVGADRALARQDRRDPVERDAQRLGQGIGGHAQRLEKFLPQNLAGM